LAYILIRPEWDSLFLNMPHIQVKRDNKFGIKTFKGNDILEAKYEQISKFVDGFLTTRILNNWGIYSTTGLNCGPQMELNQAEIGKGGKAIVSNKNSSGLWDLKQKKWLLENSNQILQFSSSQNWISISKSGTCSIYDLARNQNIQTPFDSISVLDADDGIRAFKGNKVSFTSFPSFAEGKYFDNASPLAAKKMFLCELNKKKGVVKNISLIVEPIYDLITYYSGSIDSYLIGSNSGKQSLMDINGKVLYEVEYSRLIPTTKKNSIFVKDYKWGLASNTGGIIYEAKFDSITSPRKELDLWDFPLIGWKKGKSQLLDEKGKMLSDLEKFEWIYLSEGLWAQNSKEGYKLFNSIGLRQGELTFEKIDQFNEGSAPAKQNGKWGFINPFGRFNIPNQFEQVIAFKSGIAYAKQNGKWGVLKKNGSWLVKPIGIEVAIEENGKRRLVMP